MTADPGPDLARREDSHWRNKVSQEVQRIEPDLFCSFVSVVQAFHPLA